MATWSVPFTDTTVPGPQVGDGRPYTAAEWRILWKYMWARGNADRGVFKGALNACAVTVLAANSLQVDTGLIMVNGGIVIMETASTLAPASAGAGTTRKDSVIAELDLNNSGVGQNKVRVTYKQGTAGAYPAMTQNGATVWQIELYRYIIDDAGAITGLTDVRQYLRPAAEFDHGELSGLTDDDHTQYYNAARHTKAVHDALNIDAATVGGYSAASLLAATGALFLGMRVGWGGAIGGSDGHRPIVGGSALESWHLSNGDLVAPNNVQTVDSRNRVEVGAGDTYAVGAVGGAATVDASHTHAKGTLAAANEAAHTHNMSFASSTVAAHYHTISGATQTNGSHTHTASTAASISDQNVTVGFGANVSQSGHTHAVTVVATGVHNHDINVITSSSENSHNHTVSGTTVAGTAHGHTVTGSTASGGSATLSVMQPYVAIYNLTYVGT